GSSRVLLCEVWLLSTAGPADPASLRSECAWAGARCSERVEFPGNPLRCRIRSQRPLFRICGDPDTLDSAAILFARSAFRALLESGRIGGHPCRSQVRCLIFIREL